MRRDEQLDAMELEISRLRMANDGIQEERRNLQTEIEVLRKALSVAQHFYDLDQMCPLCIYLSSDGKKWTVQAACSMHRRIAALEDKVKALSSEGKARE